MTQTWRFHDYKQFIWNGEQSRSLRSQKRALMEQSSQSTVKQKQAAEHQSVLLSLGSDCPASGYFSQSFLHLCGAMWSFGQWNETNRECTTFGPVSLGSLYFLFFCSDHGGPPWRLQHHKMEWGCMRESPFIGELPRTTNKLGTSTLDLVWLRKKYLLC